MVRSSERAVSVQRLTTALELAGGALIVAGVALVFIPAALIVAGVLALTFSWALARTSPSTSTGGDV